MNISLSLRFCVMMFLQFFIWGVWYVPMWKFLGNVQGVGDWQLWGFLTPVGLAYASTGIAAMVSPFIVGITSLGIVLRIYTHIIWNNKKYKFDDIFKNFD